MLNLSAPIPLLYSVYLKSASKEIRLNNSAHIAVPILMFSFEIVFFSFHFGSKSTRTSVLFGICVAHAKVMTVFVDKKIILRYKLMCGKLV